MSAELVEHIAIALISAGSVVLAAYISHRNKKD
jgi:hypothetical protein